MRQLLNGNEAAAHAARLARVEVLASYPITPAAPVMEKITQFITEGSLKCNFVRVESDHSALAAALGATMAGARSFLITNSQGLAYMSEVLYHVSGLRQPVVMAVVNRALAAPHSRFPEHGDVVAQEASGWVQLFCENNQEVLDSLLQAFRLGEDERVRLPVMVNYEGYIQSHTRETVDLPEQEAVDTFLPLVRRPVLDVNNPLAVNTVTGPELYMDYKYHQDAALQRAGEVLQEVSAAYATLAGRDWGGPVTGYRLEDAAIVLVAMGSLVSTARIAVDALRAAGEKAGLLKIRLFRPFPAAAVRESLQAAQAIVALDKNIVYGAGGALARELRAGLYGRTTAPVYSYILGLGGRDVGVEDLTRIYRQVREQLGAGTAPASYQWYGL
ncbi:Thiamin diphosphate-binding fold [Moorella glycerini]|uniref:Pyruvate synthase subunit PorA n=1 Tax=Neomoorella stamsii TaxID=1266720 RepID=A0A9X7J1E7_9FIRM|nr:MULTISPECIES: transketolase C-terminal domain-containing protein [Moorella]PRR69950.1 Pyruvate synthase subunit PorA [Moorella stamsii]CEP68499.1 Thiamin diphosphate-binding fold [Moorella glycerini]